MKKKKSFCKYDKLRRAKVNTVEKFVLNSMQRWKIKYGFNDLAKRLLVKFVGINC